jgi:hypothetical protein
MTWQEFLAQQGIGGVQQDTGSPIYTGSATYGQIMPGSVLPTNANTMTPDQIGYWQTYVLPNLITSQQQQQAVQDYQQRQLAAAQAAYPQSEYAQATGQPFQGSAADYAVSPDDAKWLAWYQETQGKPFEGGDIYAARYGSPTGGEGASMEGGTDMSQGCFPGAGMDCGPHANKPDKTGLIAMSIFAVVISVVSFGAAAPAAGAMIAGEAAALATAEAAAVAADASIAAGMTAADASIGAAAAQAASSLGTLSSVADSVSGVLTAVGEAIPNISGPIGQQLASGFEALTGVAPSTDLGLGVTVQDVGTAAGKGLLGAGKGALQSAITGGDPLKGAIGGGIGGLAGGLTSSVASGGARALNDVLGLGLGNAVISGIGSTFGGAAGGAAGAAATGGDPGRAAALGAGGGAAGALGGYLGGEVGGTTGADIGRTGASTLANYYLGQALGTSPASAAAATGAVGSPSTAPVSAPTTGTSAIASLFSAPSDPGYSSPLMGTQSDSSKTGPTPWNQASLRTADATGSSV